MHKHLKSKAAFMDDNTKSEEEVERFVANKKAQFSKLA
jgi:hypothetical protein